MKRIIYIFALLSICGFAPKKPVHSAILNTSKETRKAILKESSDLYVTNSESIPASKKLKRKKPKSTQPLFYLPTESSKVIPQISNNQNFSSHQLYLIRMFFSNEKRGPPSLSI